MAGFINGRCAILSDLSASFSPVNRLGKGREVVQRFLNIQLPWVVAGFGRGKIVNYESQVAGQGYSVAYHGLFHQNSAEATVYFYTNCSNYIPDGCDDEIIVDTFRDAIDEIIFTNNNLLKCECNVIKVGKYALHDDGAAYLYAGFEIISSSDRKQSHMFFRGYAGRFFKIRLSLPAEETFDNAPFKFIQEFADLAGM